VPIPELVVDVTHPSQLDQVKAGLSGINALAVDIEADSMHHFQASLCWVQLGTDVEIWLVDTLAPGVNIGALAEVFADPSRTKYFHAAGGDLQYLAESGVRVAGLFDTHRAATLLGWPKVGLGDLVLEKLGTTLKKEHQQADFSVRPLPPELRAYIADDVRYLSELGRLVQQACRDADILEEVELDCARMCVEASERRSLEDAELKIPRQGLSVKQVQLALAIGRALHTLRLSLAQAADLPMGRMLSNNALGEIASKAPTTLKDLGRLQGVRGAFAREHGEAVLTIVREQIEAQRNGTLVVVEEKKVSDPKRRKREEALVAFRKEAAAARKVTASAVLPNALIDDLATANPTNLEELAGLKWFGEKRLARYADAVLAALAAVK